MVPKETVSFVFPRYRLGKDQDLRETKLTSFPRDHTLVPSYLFRLSLKQSCAVVIGARATTAQLHPGHNRFEFDQGHVTKNQPITVLVLLSESPGI